MMTSFDQRESAFEAEFAHQEDIKFKVRERAVRLLALCAAECLDKTADSREAYASDIVATDVASPKPGAVLERVATDLGKKGVSEEEVRREMDRFLMEADAAIRGSTPASQWSQQCAPARS
jgi:hypothetical protein